jgi:Lon protease-like protein
MLMSNRSLTPQGDLGVTGFMEYGTLLEITNYEILRDGRSIVESRGISRFRVRAHGMLDGYHIGRVERVEDVSLAEEERQEAAETRAAMAFNQEARSRGQEIPPQVAVDSLSTRQLLDHCMDFIERTRSRSAPWLSGRAVEIYGRPPSDPAVFPYWFASVLPIDEEEKYVFLQTTRVRERLKIVVGWIQRIEGQRW